MTRHCLSVQGQIQSWAPNIYSINHGIPHQTEIGSIFLQHKLLDFSFHCCLSIWLHTIFPSDLFHHGLDQQTSQVVFKSMSAFLWHKVNFSTSLALPSLVIKSWYIIWSWSWCNIFLWFWVINWHVWLTPRIIDYLIFLEKPLDNVADADKIMVGLSSIEHAILLHTDFKDYLHFKKVSFSKCVILRHRLRIFYFIEKLCSVLKQGSTQAIFFRNPLNNVEDWG